MEVEPEIETPQPWYKSKRIWAEIVLACLLVTFVALFFWLLFRSSEAETITILAPTGGWIANEGAFRKSKLKWVDDFPNSINRDTLEEKIKEHGADLVSIGYAEWHANKVLDLKFSVPIMKNLDSSDMFAKITSKKGLNEFCSSVGYGELFPKKFQRKEDIRTDDFPIMVKPAQGLGGKHVKDNYKIAWNHNGIDGNFKDNTQYMYSEFVPGKIEASLHFVYANGKFVRSRMTEKNCKTEHGIDHQGDCGSSKEVSINKALKEKVKRMLKEMDYKGIGCVDLKYKNSDRSKPKILELNARPCGSMIRFDDYAEWIRDWSLISLVSF